MLHAVASQLGPPWCLFLICTLCTSRLSTNVYVPIYFVVPYLLHHCSRALYKPLHIASLALLP